MPTDQYPAPVRARFEARLAAELKAEVARLTKFYELTGPADGTHERAVLRGDIMVPSVVGVALEVADAVERFVAAPPENLRTRARLAEQLGYRAGLARLMVADVFAALDTITPPADIASAIEAACEEVALREDLAAGYAGLTYDPGDEAAEAASFIAAETRGEARGARRVLAILLGLPADEAEGGGQVEAYVAEWRNRANAAALDSLTDIMPAAEAAPAEPEPERVADTPPGLPRLDGPAAYYVEQQGSTPAAIIMLREALAEHKPGDDWTQVPLFMTHPDQLNAPAAEGERAQIRAHAAVIVPIRYEGTPPPGERVPDEALNGLEAHTFHSADKLAEFLEAHVWNHDALRWHPVDGAEA